MKVDEKIQETRDLTEATPGGTAPAAVKDRPAIRLTTPVILAWILGLGLVIRLIHFWTLSDTPFLRLPVLFKESDMHTFWQWAQTILAGDLLGRDTYHPFYKWMNEIAPLETWYRWWGGKEVFQQVPFYPYWVAGLLALSWNSLGFVILAQLLLGALHALVIFWLARRLFDERVALIAAALTAFYGPFIFHQGVLLRDWLPPMVEPLALLALIRAQASGQGRDWLVGGAALGLALFIKETILLFLPLVLLWLVLEHRGAVRQVARPAALLLAGIIAVMSPVFIRNALVGAPIFALSNRAAAEAFIEANAADGFPIGLTIPPSMKRVLEQADGRGSSVIRGTLQTYHGDWLRFLKLQLLKLRALADPLEVPNNVNFYYGLEISPVLRFTLGYGMIFPLGVTGFLLSLKTLRRHRLLVIYAVATVGALMAGNILGRYRLTLVPVLVIYGAAGLWSLVQGIQGRQTAKSLGCLGLILGLALVQHLLLPIQEVRDMPQIALHHAEYSVSAHAYAAEGRLDRAVAEMERLQAKARKRPSFAEFVRENSLYEGSYRLLWATELVREGRVEEARKQVELVEAATHDQPRLHRNLGIFYLGLGDVERARANFQQYLQVEPEGSRADAVRDLLDRIEGSP